MTDARTGVLPSSPNIAPPSAQQVVLLQSVRSYPCVSLLANTEPGPAMRDADAARLRALLDSTEQRLRAERVPDLDHLLTAARRLVDEAVVAQTGRAIAVFACRHMASSVRLPVDVRERAVVDPTFATRDLVRALHRTPRHVLLVLTGRDARLYDGSDDDLRPARTTAFPMADTSTTPHSPSRGAGRTARHADADAFLRRVDHALSTYLQQHPAPLVIAGHSRTLARFSRVTRNPDRLAGQIAADVVDGTLAQLAARTRPVLEQYLRSRQQEALDLLNRRMGVQRAVSGMANAWWAARRERPEMLAVEPGLFFPARLSGDGELLLPSTDVELPDVLDNAVDELIDLVLERGGWVALVDDGTLAAHGGVALTVRARS